MDKKGAFSPSILLSGLNQCKLIQRQFDIFKKDIIIMPINLGNAHWVCAAINISKKRFEYYDSMGRINYAVLEVQPSGLYMSRQNSFSDFCRDFATISNANTRRKRRSYSIQTRTGGRTTIIQRRLNKPMAMTVVSSLHNLSSVSAGRMGTLISTRKICRI